MFSTVVFFHRPQSLASKLYPDEQSSYLPQAGPHVVNAALEVASYLGAHNLLLVGCDFGTVNRKKPRSSLAYDNNTRVINLAVSGSRGNCIY